ncbi:hypothetical protein LEP1GSC111_0639 [Leptospira interrogans str. UT126]|uniref:Uncharacterized protein n=1 Tax=Leptospira interrogans serovar Zanoni str. LT2156 TaxID=1001601 RepID=M6HKE6_LEPIR|nr:hypothetical protein LEP1GSC111_0639 [Leptospira interrogans str. UT126]EMM97585.1 hypothetical protein LEP1GSC158_3004 [Leptospira interrogans serovar Zanoni str. LT2156]
MDFSIKRDNFKSWIEKAKKVPAGNQDRLSNRRKKLLL